MFWILFFTLFGFGCGLVLETILASQNVPKRVRRNYLKRFLSFWFGVAITLLYSLRTREGAYTIPAPETVQKDWRILPDGVLVPKYKNVENTRFSSRFIDESSEKPIIFITTTEYSIVQNALLTRLGQALYPVRENIRWIIVHLPFNESIHSEELYQQAEEAGKLNITFGEEISNREDLIKQHLEKINDLVSRFGVPFKLLRSDKVERITWAGFDLTGYVRHYQSKAYLHGLLWALRRFSKGLLLLGDEIFTYNSALFWEIRKTKIASCWPIALGISGSSRISFPIVKSLYISESNKHKPVGYQNEKSHDSVVPVQRSGFAIDLEFVRKHISYMNYWKLVFDKLSTNIDYNIKLNQIEVFGMDQPKYEIYVWRTDILAYRWPKNIKMNRDFFDSTNIIPLLKNAFGPRYYLMREKNNIKEKINFTHYQEYELERDLKNFI